METGSGWARSHSPVRQPSPRLRPDGKGDVGAVPGAGRGRAHGGRATGRGRLDEADGHFAVAVELAERTGAHVVLARTRLDWARLLIRRDCPGDRDRALVLAAAARDLARTQDAPGLAQQAAELLLTRTYI